MKSVYTGTNAYTCATNVMWCENTRARKLNIVNIIVQLFSCVNMTQYKTLLTQNYLCRVVWMIEFQNQQYKVHHTCQDLSSCRNQRNSHSYTLTIKTQSMTSHTSINYQNSSKSMQRYTYNSYYINTSLFRRSQTASTRDSSLHYTNKINEN